MTSTLPRELTELIATKPFYLDGMRKIAEFLPESDAELHEWLMKAAEVADENTFVHLFAAAGLANRKLQATLLPWAMAFRAPAWHIAWIGWRMEGDVTEQMLVGIEEKLPVNETYALGLFVATQWWREHHKGKEMPRRLPHLAALLTQRKNLDPRTVLTLISATSLMGGEAEKQIRRVLQKVPAAQLPCQRTIKQFMAVITGPFEDRLHERRVTVLSSALPVRRAQAKIGPNEPCPCGSGKKYKRCCWKEGLKRASDLSPVAGVTRAELEADPHIGLTEERLLRMRVAEVLRLDPSRLPKELQQSYFLVLGIHKQHEKVVEGFEKLGVPEHLHAVWANMFIYFSHDWRPDMARKLVELFPEAEEKLNVKIHAGTRALLVGDDPAKLLEELRCSSEALLRSGDLEELKRLAATLLDSPYRAMGILFARSMLPLVKEEQANELYEWIVDARAKLDLSPDDEFSAWMDEHALRKTRENETAAMQEARDKLIATREAFRREKEQNVRLVRELALFQKRQRNGEEKAKTAAPVDAEAREKIRDLEAKLRYSNALVKERGEERMIARRAVEQMSREVEVLKAQAADVEREEDEKGREDYKVSGKQPVRLIAFAKPFAEKVREFETHVGRAAMNRLGRIASGEPSAFDFLKSVVALSKDKVIEARVANRYRVLLYLEPERVCAVDLVYRPELDRAIDHYVKAGLPAMS